MTMKTTFFIVTAMKTSNLTSFYLFVSIHNLIEVLLYKPEGRGLENQ
jgi:hypothetical protein